MEPIKVTVYLSEELCGVLHSGTLYINVTPREIPFSMGGWRLHVPPSGVVVPVITKVFSDGGVIHRGDKLIKKLLDELKGKHANVKILGDRLAALAYPGQVEAV
jgi:hypothetical protein